MSACTRSERCWKTSFCDHFKITFSSLAFIRFADENRWSKPITPKGFVAQNLRAGNTKDGSKSSESPKPGNDVKMPHVVHGTGSPSICAFQLWTGRCTSRCPTCFYHFSTKLSCAITFTQNMYSHSRVWHYGIVSGGLFATATVVWLGDSVRRTYWLSTRGAQESCCSSCWQNQNGAQPSQRTCQSKARAINEIVQDTGLHPRSLSQKSNASFTVSKLVDSILFCGIQQRLANNPNIQMIFLSDFNLNMFTTETETGFTLWPEI